jgi:hypothetical protein
VNWQVVWIAVIAICTLVLTTIQIVLLLRVAKLAQQAASAIEELRSEFKPLIGKVHKIADDASRATSLALVQIERIDRLLTVTAERVDDTVNVFRSAVTAPLKSGTALVGVFRAAMAIVSEWRKSRARREDEDAMFVG